MTAFTAAIDAIFADPNVAADAVWESPKWSGSPQVRVIRKSPDVLQGFGAAQFHAQSNMFDVRRSDVAEPTKGDVLAIGTERFVVQSEPVLDRLQLVWTLDVRPVA